MSSIQLRLLLHITLLIGMVCPIQAQDDETLYRNKQSLSQEIAFQVRDTYRLHKDKIPTETALQNMPINTNLPANLNEILYLYDWLEVGDYSIMPEGNRYNLNNANFYLLRYHSKKGILKFKYNLWMYGERAELIYEHNDNNIPKHIIKKGTHFYMADVPNNFEKIHYDPIVDYRDGILIIDITYSGTLNDFANPRRYRTVYMAIPKFF